MMRFAMLRKWRSPHGIAMMLTIREAIDADWPAIWSMFRAVVTAGDVFAYDSDTPESVARALWGEPPSRAFIAEWDGQIVGTYYLKPNQPGRGAHVANAGYMVTESARGRGVASAMCAHSIDTARRLGFTAMQFNYVISTNVAAIRVWEKHGFATIGRIPRAFRHATLGLVDVLIMYREL